MNIQLIKGQFSPQDAIDIITQMVNIKIKFHQNKIHSISNEEDVKNREAKIKQLQKELFEVRNEILLKTEPIKVDSVINIE